MPKRRQILPLLFLGALLFTSLQCCVLINANFKPIPHSAVLITGSGEIEPTDAPMTRSGNVYTFTGNWTKYVLKVERSNVVIDGAGFYIVGNSVGQGIGFYKVQGVSVVNVNIIEVNRGIYLEQCSDLTISGCTITGGNNGIYLNGSINNEVSDNRVISAFNGITLDHSANNKLQNNSIENSHKYGFGLDFLVTGQSVTDYTNNVDASNTVNGAPIIYWVNHQNEVVASNAAYVALVNCKGITVENLHITKTQGILTAWTTNSTIANNYLDLNSNGIHLLYCSDIKIVNNEVWRNSDIEDGGDGVRLDYSQFVTVANNKLTDNDNGGVTCNNSSKNQIIGNVIGQNHYNGVNLVGHSDFNLVALNYFFNHTTMSRGAVFIEDSENNTIAANNFTHNGCWAIQFKGHQRDNLIYANNFQNNSYYNTRYTVGALQVSTPGTENANTWQHNGLGNYWSDYTGSDSNSDGIGDTPYFINPNNIDNYPVMTAIDTSNVPLDIKELSLLAPEFSLWNLPVIIVAVMIIAAMCILFKRKNTC
jgi:parallel beta-helix repeat protein